MYKGTSLLICSALLISGMVFSELAWKMSFEALFELDAFQVVGLQPCSLAMLNFCGSIQLCVFLLQKTQKC